MYSETLAERSRQSELTGAPLLMNFAPRMVARGAVKARTMAEKAFIKYYKDGDLDHASSFAKARFRPPSEYDLSLEDSARLEFSLLFGVLSTSVPVAFWTISRICAKIDLLSDLRSELETIIVIDTSAQRTTFVVEIDWMKSKCPPLASIYQEVLRIHSCFSFTRVVLKDTIIDDKYVLKKGGMILIPSNIIHASTSAWGPNATETDFRRFMPKEFFGIRQAPHTFRSFGCPPNPCRGRHFADKEALLSTLDFSGRHIVIASLTRVLDITVFFLLSRQSSTQLKAFSKSTSPALLLQRALRISPH